MTLAACTQVHATTDLTTITCGQCGGIYAIAEKYRNLKNQEGGFWHCPYCQCGWGYSQSENQKLKAQLLAKDRDIANERKRTEWAEQNARVTERRRRAIKGMLTKTKNRISHGVCPCCNRSFDNVQRHMKTKHPKYVTTAN